MNFASRIGTLAVVAAAVFYAHVVIHNEPGFHNCQYYLSGSIISSAKHFGFLPDDILSPVFSVETTLLATKDVLLRHPQRNSYAKQENEDNNYSLIGWSLILVFLLALSLILLFQIRKREAMAKKIRLMAEERKILFDHAPCGYHSTDAQGVIINVNDTFAQWLGYEQHELIGKRRFNDIVSGDADALVEKLAAMSRSKSGQIDITLVKKSGEPLPVILRAINIHNLITTQGEHFYGTIDNRRCHDAMERIRNLDQELEAFSYSISHDLRAPLRSIDGYSKILQEDYADRLDEEGRRVLNVVMSNAKRMGKLIDDLLNFGRLGRKPLQRSNVNMTSMVQATVQDLQGQEPGRRIQVTIEKLAPASADADMLREVWFNLLENAFKFTGKKQNAIITVRSCKAEHNEVCYEVKDNGVGFDMKYASKLFGIFQRLHKMQDFTGTGVGLAIVKRIITRHGGRVWAESVVDDGATFYFTLPTDNENA